MGCDVGEELVEVREGSGGEVVRGTDDAVAGGGGDALELLMALAVRGEVQGLGAEDHDRGVVGGEELAGGELKAERLGARVAGIHDEAILAIATPLALDEAALDGGGEVQLDDDGLGGSLEYHDRGGLGFGRSCRRRRGGSDGDGAGGVWESEAQDDDDEE
jgi:hypothetical protein